MIKKMQFADPRWFLKPRNTTSRIRRARWLQEMAFNKGLTINLTDEGDPRRNVDGVCHDKNAEAPKSASKRLNPLHRTKLRVALTIQKPGGLETHQPHQERDS